MNSSTGLTSIVALGIASISLAIGLTLAAKLRKLKADQSVLLDSGERRDVIGEAAANRSALADLAGSFEQRGAATDQRFDSIEVALSRSVSGFSLVRYDAFDEASGQQSVSIALVDSGGSGVVLSSLVRRDSARMYARLVGEEGDESGLSPEEVEAVRTARERSTQP